MIQFFGMKCLFISRYNFRRFCAHCAFVWRWLQRCDAWLPRPPPTGTLAVCPLLRCLAASAGRAPEWRRGSACARMKAWWSTTRRISCRMCSKQRYKAEVRAHLIAKYAIDILSEFDCKLPIVACLGEGNAVAVNMLLVSMLEEMYKAEQLWASHAGSNKLASQSAR